MVNEGSFPSLGTKGVVIIFFKGLKVSDGDFCDFKPQISFLFTALIHNTTKNFLHSS